MQYTSDQEFPGTLTDEHHESTSVDQRLASVIAPVSKTVSPVGADGKKLYAVEGLQTQHAEAVPGGAAPRPRLARSPLSNSHNGPRLEYAVGGTYAKLCIPGIESPSKPAKRGIVTDFSAKSRRNQQDMLSKIDHGQLAAFAEFVTLTYPCRYAKDRKAWYADLRAFIKALKRRYNIQVIIWKLEPQMRLAPHYHLLIFSHDEMDNDVVAQLWHDRAGGGDPNHLAWHRGELGDGNKPCMSRMNSFDGVRAYVSKYCGKDVSGGDLPPWWHGGRWWGVLGDLPMAIETVDLTVREAIDLRRMMRSFYKSKVGGGYKDYGMSGIKVYPKQHTIEAMLSHAVETQRDRLDQTQPDLVDLHLLAARGKTANQGITKGEHDQYMAGQREQERLKRYGIEHRTPEDCRSVMDKYGFGQVEKKWGAA